MIQCSRTAPSSVKIIRVTLAIFAAIFAAIFRGDFKRDFKSPESTTGDSNRRGITSSLHGRFWNRRKIAAKWNHRWNRSKNRQCKRTLCCTSGSLLWNMRQGIFNTTYILNHVDIWSRKGSERACYAGVKRFIWLDSPCWFRKKCVTKRASIAMVPNYTTTSKAILTRSLLLLSKLVCGLQD